MLQNLKNILHQVLLPGRSNIPIRAAVSKPNKESLQAIGITDFLKLDVPAREMLLSPILPERSLAMLYAPRGVGKSWLGLSIGLAVAAGESLLRWSAPRQRNVLYVDGEMPLGVIAGTVERDFGWYWGAAFPNDRFRILAADNVDRWNQSQHRRRTAGLEPLLGDIDLLILDNLSTLLTSRSETASDAWVPMQTLVAQASSARKVGVAHSSCRHEWPTERHIEKGGCARYGDSVAETGRLFAGTGSDDSKFILKNYEIGWKASELCHLKHGWTPWKLMDNNAFVGLAAT